MAGSPAQARLARSAEVQPRIPTGEFVSLDGEIHYRIAAYHRLAPFLMSLASDTDLWMFVTSGGGLTAGRIDAEHSLFPYQTIDQLHDGHHHTGPVTLIRVENDPNAPVLWEPFCAANDESPTTERNLYKNTLDNRVVFEEIDHALGLAFRYRWAACDEFGWVRTATLENLGSSPARVAVLDGLRNVLPHGAPLSLYQQASNLVDAYKTSEIDPESGLGIFSLTAGITDRAEALEVLRANTVWCSGLENVRIHLSAAALQAFRHGRVVAGDQVLNGERGNYLVSATLDLEPGRGRRWHLAGDVARDHVQIAELRRALRTGVDVDAALPRADESLRRIVASADGLQLTGRPEASTHHLANVLFNSMRGGVFAHNHDVVLADFVAFLDARNVAVAEGHRERLGAWPDTLTVQSLVERAHATGDADLERLAREYLPLFFGRRHGDPSRPWNRFAIRARDRDGRRILSYEGNWRDIFQNWEALSASFPGFLPGFVARFVNASTVDGFNPYRITSEGLDWETVSPDDPWSNIGYWGDHQIVYLLRLLETLNEHDPDAIATLLGAEIFSYAEVPYRIKPYADLLRDPAVTIDFDGELAARIEDRVKGQGADGKLLHGRDGTVHHANLLEKLLVPALSKLSNLIPDAGIWMNTQRPEWNDANNALAAGGISVVTLCHLRRYLAFLADLVEAPGDEPALATEVADWFDGIASTLTDEAGLLGHERLDPRDRKRVMDRLGESFSVYRETVYESGFSGRRRVARHRIAALCRTALRWVDQGLAANRREDGLYHAYNLMEIVSDGDGVEIGRLPVMLEGQVAVLSSGALAPAAALEILEGLYASDLYWQDQRSFLLYPDRTLPGFLARNTVPEARVEAVPLLRDLLAADDRSLLARDGDGIYRFHGDLQNEADIAAVLDDLARRPQYSDAVARDRTAVCDLFADVFDHRSYTGRSGVMYGYEGLGCIYWHMVAKLLLAVQENVLRAEREGAPASVREGLARMYLRVRSGIGYEKTVAEYGAFPTDPYSHTPADGGAKQPGMTGQVKEEILTRLGELGVHVEEGAVRFEPVLLGEGEFRREPGEFHYIDTSSRARTIAMPSGSLAFTLCQVPVVYEATAKDPWIRVGFADGSASDRPGNTLDPDVSAELFSRSGHIDRIRVGIRKDALRDH